MSSWNWNLQDFTNTTSVLGTISGNIVGGGTATSGISTGGPGGSFSKSFNLNGSTRVEITPDSGLNAISGQLGVSWWMYGIDYTTTLAEQFAGVVCKDGAGPGDEWGITINGGTGLRLRQNNVNRAFSGPISTGAWHHYVMDYNGTSIQFYEDGAVLGAATAVSGIDLSNTQSLYFARDNTNGRGLIARMAGVTISDTSFGATGVAALYSEGFASSGDSVVVFTINPLVSSILGIRLDPLSSI